VIIETPTQTKPNSKNKLTKIKSKNLEKKQLDKLMEENPEAGEILHGQKADENSGDEDLDHDGEIVVKMIKRKATRKPDSLLFDDGASQEESHTVSMLSPTITLETSTIVMDDDVNDARKVSYPRQMYLVFDYDFL